MSTNVFMCTEEREGKAEKLILDGADLQIISESTFLDLLAYGEE